MAVRRYWPVKINGMPACEKERLHFHDRLWAQAGTSGHDPQTWPSGFCICAQILQLHAKKRYMLSEGRINCSPKARWRSHTVCWLYLLFFFSLLFGGMPSELLMYAYTPNTAVSYLVFILVAYFQHVYHLL